MSSPEEFYDELVKLGALKDAPAYAGLDWDSKEQWETAWARCFEDGLVERAFEKALSRNSNVILFVKDRKLRFGGGRKFVAAALATDDFQALIPVKENEDADPIYALEDL